jgi:uncharacterized protein (DUF1330 family)
VAPGPIDAPGGSGRPTLASVPGMTSDVDALLEELAGHGLGGINPDRAQLRALLEADRDGPLHFVNLLRFHDEARYPEGHGLAGAGLTGERAYARYGEVALEQVVRRGGRLVTFNAVEQTIIGVEGGWHQVATMEYRDTGAFVDMVRDPAYAAALVDRDAGLADTLVLVTRPLLS